MNIICLYYAYILVELGFKMNLTYLVTVCIFEAL